MVPVIPMLCIVASVCSALGLKWYYGLSKEEQREADKYAAQLALDLYDASLDRLSKAQADVIYHKVKQRYSA